MTSDLPKPDLTKAIAERRERFVAEKERKRAAKQSARECRERSLPKIVPAGSP